MYVCEAACKDEVPTMKMQKKDQSKVFLTQNHVLYDVQVPPCAAWKLWITQLFDFLNS